MHDMGWIVIPSPEIDMRGLVGSARGLLHRLPGTCRAELPDDTWTRSCMASGVRLVFCTDSPRVDLRFEYVTTPRRATFLDTYVDGAFVSSQGQTEAGPCSVTLVDGMSGDHEIEVYMPPYAELRVDGLGVVHGHRVRAPAAAPARRIIFHGDSITHGAITTRAGLTYPARVAQRLGADFVNLGFGGSARGESGVAHIIAGLVADAIVIFYGINTFALGCATPTDFGGLYSRFIDIIRASHGKTPIVAITPTWHVPERHARNLLGSTVEDYRAVIRQAIGSRMAAGDMHLVLLEGCSVIGPGDATRLADMTHPNDEGFSALAERLVPLIERSWSEQ